MSYSSTQDASPSQRERLWHIDFLARFRGQVTRQDLASRFQVALSHATRDFTLYRQLAPTNLEYDHSVKAYLRTERFQPLFSYDREHTLQALTLGQGIGMDICEQPILVNSAKALNQPNLDILATVSRAIYANKALMIEYVSASSGDATREVVPHSLVNTGLRWHVRSFCRKHQAFRDFVLTRIIFANECSNSVVQPKESIKQDQLWNLQVQIELTPHPRASFARAIELDYGLKSGEALHLTVRAATAGYLLRRWGVDCSKHSSLSPFEYQLALRNLSTVCKQADLSIAPGFNHGNT